MENRQADLTVATGGRSTTPGRGRLIHSQARLPRIEESRQAVCAALGIIARLAGGVSDENEWYRVTKVSNKESFLFEPEGMARAFYRSMTDEEHAALQSLCEAIKANFEPAYAEGGERSKDILLPHSGRRHRAE